LRIGSELSSTEAIKQMCVAGFGAAFLSLHTCRLELDADLLQLLPLDSNPVEREWFVLHLASRQLPQVAVAFEQFLTAQGQRLIHAQLQTSIESKPRVAGRRPRPDRAALITD